MLCFNILLLQNSKSAYYGKLFHTAVHSVYNTDYRKNSEYYSYKAQQRCYIIQPPRYGKNY